MRIFLLFSFCLFFVPVYAQITVDRNDFGDIGDTVLFERTIFGLDSLSPGPSGASQVWDFSGLQIDSIPDTLLFLDPQNFPQSNTLDPSINIVLKDGASLQFLEANLSGIFGHALTLDLDTFVSNLLVESNPKLDVYNFPMNFGDLSSGTYNSGTITLPVKDTLSFSTFTFYVDSARITPTINKTDSVNAFGQLLLPGQQQFDVLRQKSVINISLDLSVLIPNPIFPLGPPFIWFQLPSGIFPDIQNGSYSFVAKAQKYPVLELTTDSLDQIISARFQMDTSSNDTTINSLALTEDLINLYPNPVNNLLKISGLKYQAVYEVRDQLGKLLKKGNLKLEDNFINLENLKPGFYILNINSSDSKGNTQFRLLKN